MEILNALIGTPPINLPVWVVATASPSATSHCKTLFQHLPRPAVLIYLGTYIVPFFSHKNNNPFPQMEFPRWRQFPQYRRAAAHTINFPNAHKLYFFDDV